MVSLLTAAVIVVGALCTLDLLLTFGVIRRLKAHTAHLEQLLAGGPGGAALPSVGASIDEFAATTTDGESVSRARLNNPTVVAFFSPGCGPCRDTLPLFAAGASERGGDRARILAVISGPGGANARPGEAGEMAQSLTGLARVIVDTDWTVSKAFGVGVFPGFCVVDDTGTIIASGSASDLDQILTALGPAPTAQGMAGRPIQVSLPS